MNIVYLILFGVAVGSALTFVGALIQDQEMQDRLYRKAAATRVEKVSVRDNGPVRTPPASVPVKSPEPNSPQRALV